MKNLKDETLEVIIEIGKSIEDVDYCHVYKCTWVEDEKIDYCYGKLNIDSLNFKYDEGYGSQEVGGFIVFKDGTWIDRREYDGAEWWEYQSKPVLSKDK